MITLHGEEVKAGDPVWHVFKGWGEVLMVDNEPTFCPILVHWEDGDEWYTEDGKFQIDDKTPVLFWQPAELKKLKKPILEVCHYEYPVVDESEESEAGMWPVLVPNGFKIVKDNQPTDERVRELEAKYSELIMAVAIKYPNETCHETILRYIRQAESSDGNCDAKKEANK